MWINYQKYCNTIEINLYFGCRSSGVVSHSSEFSYKQYFWRWKTKSWISIPLAAIFQNGRRLILLSSITPILIIITIFLKIYSKYAHYLIKYAWYKNVPSRNGFYTKNYPRILWQNFRSDHYQIVIAFALSITWYLEQYYMGLNQTYSTDAHRDRYECMRSWAQTVKVERHRLTIEYNILKTALDVLHCVLSYYIWKQFWPDRLAETTITELRLLWSPVCIITSL